MNLEEIKDDYDWHEVFGFAGQEGAYNQSTPTSVLSEVKCNDKPFGINDVEEVYDSYEGENDEEDWLIAGKLKDGRHFMIEAGCDYTGWD